MRDESSKKFALGCYDIVFRMRGQGVLVVIFSHSPKHHFGTIDFTADVLSIVDTDDTYFTTMPEKLTSFIKDMSADYTMIITVGGSKGGHGAISHGALLARVVEKQVRALAFSPVVALHANTNDVPYVSYRRLQERARDSAHLTEQLRISTDVTTSKPTTNFKVFCFFGVGNRCDCIEAERLDGAHLLPLPMYHHESVIPFLCDTSDPKAVSRTVLVLHDKAAEEADVAHLLEKGAVDKMIADLSRIPKQPGLSELAELVAKDDIAALRNW
ncbi:hypothetical protein GOZ83_11985 [Agrobacterium vitis]|uniref:hypothetical protein n=1 Tax=Rhizobium/Agrobacterium group TaxID=227290 RepID=UPI0012E78B6B|nr:MULTISPECIES: hypothetical protein [Rhizobium/Agrobacterium group]MCF1495773.1 hypothetical protein [Allorhizobium ampelinum]MVA45792.1 hypothetical protein [Agrobacterium vitis]